MFVLQSRNRFGIGSFKDWTDEDFTHRREPTMKMRRLARDIRSNPDMQTRIIER